MTHNSFIERKPEDLETEFNNLACSKTGIMLFIEIHRGRKRIYDLAHIYLDPDTACYILISNVSVSIYSLFVYPILPQPLLVLSWIYFKEKYGLQA